MNLREIRNAILKAAYYNEVCYNILNAIMMNELSAEKDKYEPTADRKSVLAEQGLELVEEGFFRRKKTIARVRNVQDNRYVLKTGGIDPLQVALLQTAKRLESEGKLSFKVPALARQGEGWILLEEVQGKSLNAFCDTDPDWYVAVSKRIADEYQLVLQELAQTRSFGDLLADGTEWFLSRLNLWSKPIIDAGLIDFSLVQKLRTDFERIIIEKGEGLFGWAHGNIIGDHIILSGDDVYLLDLNVVPRAGRGYHDFLRALDFLLLKAENSEMVVTAIPGWIRKYASEFDEAEVKLVFAFRNIGILGWDILHHNVESVRGNLATKKESMLRFIRREW